LRAIVVVLDSLGVGELPDAKEYGDEGSNTLAHTAEAVGGLSLPNFEKLGLGNVIKVRGVNPVEAPRAFFGKAKEISAGKDSTTGHWELMGVILEKPFPTYPSGFPPAIIKEFEKRVGRKVLGNKPASGTVIIQELGEEHLKTGYPIVYTSADSVFQIAAHEEVIPVEELYRMCEIAREILKGEHAVSRVIARPFLGKKRGEFHRTRRRKDFSLLPPKDTVLDALNKAGVEVYAVGKIKDIFSGRGINYSFSTKSNKDGLEKTKRLMKEVERGFIFTNLIDFDMLWGHRNNPTGYAEGLKKVDSYIPFFLDMLRPEDLFIFTADHGCDPTTESTDHSREYIPILAISGEVKVGRSIGVRKTFADVGKTVLDWFGVKNNLPGESFSSQIKKT
jgi:phosphopentomutase